MAWAPFKATLVLCAFIGVGTGEALGTRLI